MKKNLKTALVVVVVVLGIFLLLYFFSRIFIDKFSPSTEITPDNNLNVSGKVSINKAAPYFDLLSTTGERVRLSDLSGHGSVITFWSTWNSDSVNQIKILDDYLSGNISSRKKLPINIITIDSQETETTATNFISRGGYGVKVLVDPTGATSNDYGIQTLPTTFFIDGVGNVREIYMGTLSESMLINKIEKIIN